MQRSSPGATHRAGVLAAYRDGVTIICELAAQFTDVTWLAPTPCSEWRAVDLAGRGTEVTVGAMAGAACAEWHLHAWDLARSLGKDYRPADPELVLAAWQAGTPQLWPSLAAVLAPRSDDPWHDMLVASGRDPGWTQV